MTCDNCAERLEALTSSVAVEVERAREKGSESDLVSVSSVETPPNGLCFCSALFVRITSSLSDSSAHLIHVLLRNCHHVVDRCFQSYACPFAREWAWWEHATIVRVLA